MPWSSFSVIAVVCPVSVTSDGFT